MNSLSRSPIGSLVAISGHDARFGEDYEAEAFVPFDLPTTVDLGPETWMKLTEAAAELGRLDSAAGLVPAPELITRVATRREAVGTSALEGTYADLTDVFAAEVTPTPDRRREVPPNVAEVVNYTRAAEHAYGWIQERPITLGLLCSLQSLIVAGTPSDGDDAGSLRDRQVFIGARDRRVNEARFIPPPEGDQLRSMVERWIVWLDDPEVVSAIPLVARLAMAHYQFETLHPFTDGNGRLGRLAAVLQILKEGTLRAPVLAISPWLEERADTYRDHLLRVSLTGDWGPWIDFFAEAVRDESRSGHDRIMRLLALRDELVDAVRVARPRAGLAIEITESLIAAPMLSVSDARRRFGRSNQANRNAIEALVELGLLEPYNPNRYDRLYWCRRVFQVING